MPPRKKAVVDPAGLLGPAKPASKAKAKAKKNTHSQAAKAAFPPRLDDEESNARAPVPDEEDEAVVASQRPDSSPAAASREGSVDSFALPVTPSVAARRSHLNVGTPAQQLRAKSAVAPVAAPDFASVRRSHEKLVVPMCLRCSKRVYTAKLNLDCTRVYREAESGLHAS
ncbi:hypothetical protein VC83_08533 [Pseudogymnoascus destructans]|nr:uncharacterized protein VC83_08533 [Pseudogymnoascus destructans]OAF54979.1 hypothetical protein VC83_08533 [Pseudogymnoascus destructans]